MRPGFLQGFREDQILAEYPVSRLAWTVYGQGIHLAMLNQVDIAHDIFSLLASNNLNPRKGSTREAAVRLFYLASSLDPPFKWETAEPDAIQRQHLTFSTYHRNQGGNGTIQRDWGISDVTEERFNELQQAAIREATENEDTANAASYGAAQNLSSMLSLLTYMADKLDKQAEVQNLLMTMASRIHASHQAEQLSALWVAWEKLFLNDGLLRVLELDVPQVRDYGEFVLRTLKRRFDDGPVHWDNVYKDKTIRELLAELEHNTMTDPEYDPAEDGYDHPDFPPPTTIYKEPATDAAIDELEERIGRQLPAEMKEFLKITNGCSEVKIRPGWRHWRFVPVEQMKLESDGNLYGYGVSLLPDFTVFERVWPESDEARRRRQELDFMITDVGDFAHGMAMYEHCGQGTDYFWLLPLGAVAAGKARVQEVYDKVEEEHKARIDEAIVHRYGSREAYDKMEYCICMQHWGMPEGCKVYASFMSFLRSVVYESRPSEERSPVQMSK